MLTIRRSEDRGHVQTGWLDTRHTFSFGSYYDEKHMGFRDLRVINEDVVAPGSGFPDHPHRDMEIVTVVLDGALRHRDSMGTGAVIRPGEIQRMTAGTGVVHSEFNASETAPVALLQIWILPEAKGLEPGYEQRAIELSPGELALLASRDGRDGSVVIHQDASIHRAKLRAGQQVRHALAPGRHAWIQVARGEVTVNGERLGEGDGAAITGEADVIIARPGASDGGGDLADVIVFDLA